MTLNMGAKVNGGLLVGSDKELMLTAGQVFGENLFVNRFIFWTRKIEASASELNALAGVDSNIQDN